MTGEQLVSIELSPEEAAAFREFRRVQDTFSILSESGVFAVRGGEAHINFNDDGVITKVRVQKTAWTRGR